MPAQITVTLLFFALGFITTLNNLFIPHLQQTFALNHFQSMLVQFAFFTAYFVISPLGGIFLNRLGHRKSILFALLLTTLGAYLLLLAHWWQQYAFFLFAFFTVAAGFALLQVSINPFVTQMGPIQTASSRLNLFQGFNSLGTTLSPLFVSALFISANTLQMRPIIFTMIISLMLLIILSVKNLPHLKISSGEERSQEQLSLKSLWPHILAIFIYVGVEVSVGSFIIPLLQEKSHFSFQSASNAVALYWGLTMVGRFLGSFLMNKTSPLQLLQINTLFALCLTLAILTHSVANLYPLVLLGLCHSIMFPTIFSSTLEKFPAHLASKVSSLLCMAIVGGAIFPLLQGVLADHLGTQESFVLCLGGYSYLFIYAMRSSKVRVVKFL